MAVYEWRVGENTAGRNVGNRERETGGALRWRKRKRGRIREREIEHITDNLIKNRCAHEYYIRRGTRSTVIQAHGILSLPSEHAGEMISRIFPSYINFGDPAGSTDGGN